jgi:hypothetical protein
MNTNKLVCCLMLVIVIILSLILGNSFPFLVNNSSISMVKMEGYSNAANAPSATPKSR